MNRQITFLWLLMAMLLLGGCADPNVAYVQGTVSSASQEIPAGTRLFFEKPGSGYMAAAVIGPDGSFELKYRREEEIEPGDYTVFIGPPKSTMTAKEFYELKAKVAAEYRERGEAPPPSPDWVLPVQYYASKSSPLKETIVAGKNTVAIEIK